MCKAMFPPPCPHGDIEEIATDTFLLRSQITIKGIMKFSRNMVIVRSDGDLTLVNPVRLNEAGEEKLKKLGEIKTILRLGHFHGRDDAYYKSTFDAPLLAVGPTSSYPEVKIDKIVKSASDLPFPDSDLFVFDFNDFSEGAVVIRKSEGGILLTCDTFMCHKDDALYTNWPMRKMMAKKGFTSAPVVIGPAWLKHQSNIDKCKSEFERMVKELDFKSLIAAHGRFLAEDAKAESINGMKLAFP